MIEGGPFNIGPVDVRLGQKVAIVEIVLVFGDGQSFPISGFPRHLLGDETRCKLDFSFRLMYRLSKAELTVASSYASSTRPT